MNKVIGLLKSQPVRTAFYPFVVAVAAYLVSTGVFDSSVENLIVGIAAALVGLPMTAIVHAQVAKSVVPVNAPNEIHVPPTTPGVDPAADRHA